MVLSSRHPCRPRLSLAPAWRTPLSLSWCGSGRQQLGSSWPRSSRSPSSFSSPLASTESGGESLAPSSMGEATLRVFADPLSFGIDDLTIAALLLIIHLLGATACTHERSSSSSTGPLVGRLRSRGSTSTSCPVGNIVNSGGPQSIHANQRG